jgi:hypothetical protein
MKNLLILLFTFILLVGCEKIETNSQAFEASVGDDFYRASFSKANYIENGAYFVLQGKNSNQIITLRGKYPAEGVSLIFGEGSENFAIYEDRNGIVYSTAVLGGEGSMIINEVSTEEKTITGEFNFKGISMGLETLSVTGGLFSTLRAGTPGFHERNGAGAKVRCQPQMPVGAPPTIWYAQK